MEFMEVFNAVLEVPQISNKEEFKQAIAELQIFDEVSLEKASMCFAEPISIKKLIMLAEMARQGTTGTLVERFYSAIQDNF